MKKAVTLSLVINTKNEEKKLSRCIKSAEGIVDEIIVADMQSTDKTVQIAKKLGAKVFSVPDCGFADPARNFALSKAKSQWVLTLDADEVITKKLQRKIINILEDDKFDVVKFPFKSILYGKWMKHTGWWPDYHERLFRKGHVSYFSTVHTAPKVKGKILVLPAKEENSIVHYTTETVSGSVIKIDKYTSQENHFDINKKISPQEIIEYYESEFRRRYFDNQGYLDGIQGFVFSKYMEFYRFLIFAKFWEKEGFPEIFSSAELKNVLAKYYYPTVHEEKWVDMEKHYNELNEKLRKIEDSKFYKIWIVYCQIKNLFLNITSVFSGK